MQCTFQKLLISLIKMGQRLTKEGRIYNAGGRRGSASDQGQTGRVFQLRVGSGSGIEKIFRVGSGRVGYRVFVSNTKSIGYYGVLKS